MADILIDTNVISAMRRPHKLEPQAAIWFDAYDVEDLFLSSVSIMELTSGVLAKRRTDPRQGIVLNTWLAAVRTEFAGRILGFGVESAEIAAELWQGRSRGYGDVLIAATALANGLPLATRNVKDFVDITGLHLINPWEAGS